MDNRIKTFRTLNGLSQSELANRLGISQRKVSHLETGAAEPSLSEIHTLLSLFRCSFDDLFIIKEENSLNKGALIKYVQLDNHVDPNFTHLTFGDSNKRGSRLKNIVSEGSYVFFHTSIGGNEYITGYFYIDKILEAGVHDTEIKKLNSSAKYDDIIIVGNREESKILTLPLLFDKKLAIELKSLGITAERFEERDSSELSVISNATREHRELSQIDVEIIKRKCEGRG